ncbi:hypothetical protein IAT38_004683 [Cryptococcus sp. DSM 104549]
MLFPDVGPSAMQAAPSQEKSASFCPRAKISFSIPPSTTPPVVSTKMPDLKTPCPVPSIDKGLDTPPATAARAAFPRNPPATSASTVKHPIPTGPRALRDAPPHIRRPFPPGPTPPMHTPAVAQAPPAPPPATPPIQQAPPLSSPPTTPTTPAFRVDITALSPSVFRGASSVPHIEGQPPATGGEEEHAEHDEHDEHDPMYMDTDMLLEKTPQPMKAPSYDESGSGEEAVQSGEGGGDESGLDLDEVRSLFGDEVADEEEQEDMDIDSEVASEDGTVVTKEDRDAVKTEVEEYKSVLKMEEDDHENQIMLVMDECPGGCFSGDGYTRDAARSVFEAQLNAELAQVGKRICMKSWVREGVVFTWEYRAPEKGPSMEMKVEREKEEVKDESMEMLGWEGETGGQDGGCDEQGMWGETRRPEDGMVFGREHLPTPSPSLAPRRGSMELVKKGIMGVSAEAEGLRMPTPAESVMREPEEERPVQVEETCRAPGQSVPPTAYAPPTTPPLPPLPPPPVESPLPVTPPIPHAASLPPAPSTQPSAASTQPPVPSALTPVPPPARPPVQRQPQPLEVVQGRPPKGTPIDKEYRYSVTIPGSYLCKTDARQYNIWRDKQWTKMSALDEHGIPTRHVAFMNDKHSNDKTSFMAVVTPITEQKYHIWPLTMFTGQADIPIPSEVAAGISTKAVDKSIKKWMDAKADELAEPDERGRPTKWVVSRRVAGPKVPTARFRWKDMSKEWVEKFDGEPFQPSTAQPEQAVQAAGPLPQTSEMAAPKTSERREEQVDKAVFTNTQTVRSPSRIAHSVPAPDPAVSSSRSSPLSPVPPAVATALDEPPSTPPVPFVYHDPLDESSSDDDDMGSLGEWAIGSSDDDKVENVQVPYPASAATKPPTMSSVAKETVADTSARQVAASTPTASRSCTPATVKAKSSLSTPTTKKRLEMDEERETGRSPAKVQKTEEREAATGPTVKKISGGAGLGSGLKLAGKKGGLQPVKAKAGADGLKPKKASAVLPGVSKVEGASKDSAAEKHEVQGKELSGVKRNNSASAATKPKPKRSVVPAFARKERRRIQSPDSSSSSDSDSSSDISKSEDERRPRKRALAAKPAPRRSGDGVDIGKANAPVKKAPVKKAPRLSTSGPSRAGMPPSPSSPSPSKLARSSDNTSAPKRSLTSAKLQRLKDDITDLMARRKKWAATAKEATFDPLREEAGALVKELDDQIWSCQEKYKEEEERLKSEAN